MDKGKYQPWSHEEFMSDRRVRKMSSCARKTYMMLLHEAYVCSTRPNLPDDEEELELFADCETHEEWLEVRDVVLGMFEKRVVDGEPVLVKNRLLRDWERLEEIRGLRSEAGKLGAEKRWGSKNSKLQQTDDTPLTKNSMEGSKEAKEENESKGDDMSLKTDMERVCASRAIGGKAFESDWKDLRMLAGLYKPSIIVNDFTEWLDESEGGDWTHGAVHGYLSVARDRLAAGTTPRAAIAKDPEVVSLTRELTYLSDGQLTFTDKHRARLSEVLKEFEDSEILSVFRTWWADQDLEPKNLQYLPGKFVQAADGLAYAARRRRQEAETAEIQRAATVERLQAEAEAERKKLEENKEEDFDPFSEESVV